MIAVMLAAAAAAAATPGCGEALCDAGVLAPFLDKLSENSRAPSARPVHILQIGDSHTAGDTITGGWRDILQRATAAAGVACCRRGGLIKATSRAASLRRCRARGR